MRGFVMRFMPDRMRKAAEAESRQWIGRCRHCGCETSIWDVGGLRYGAAGRPTKLLRCPHCRKIGPLTFEKRI
jgi:hypothetical protein